MGFLAGIRPMDEPAEDVGFMVTQNKFRSPELNIAPRDESEVERDQTHSGQDNAVTDGKRSLPLITLTPPEFDLCIEPGLVSR